MAYQWVTISKDAKLYEGDVVRLYYTVTGLTYLTAAQIVILEKKLESEKRFTILGHSIPEGGGWIKEIWFEVRVNKQPDEPQVQKAGLGLEIIIGAIVIGGLVWLCFREARIRTEAKAEAAKAGTPIEEGGVTTAIREAGTTGLKLAAASIIGVLVWRFIK